MKAIIVKYKKETKRNQYYVITGVRRGDLNGNTLLTGKVMNSEDLCTKRREEMIIVGSIKYPTI